MNDNTPTKLQFRKRKKKNKNLKIRESIKSKSNETKEVQANTSNIANNDNDKDIIIINKTNEAKTNTNDVNDTDEDDDLLFLNKLKEAKSMHKWQFQTKNKGLVFEENHEFTSSGLENPDTFKHDPSRDFGESFSTERIQDDKLKIQREEWVEKQMRLKLLEQGRVLPQNNNYKDKNNHKKTITIDHENNSNKTTLKEQLYALSDKLSTPLFSNCNAENNDEAGERWLAGMSEYELPLEYKLKNIKQTEDAKKKLLQPKPKHNKIFDIPRNYNQDFTTHHVDRVKFAEHKRKLQENQQKLSMEREKKRRRLMGTQWYNGNSTNL